MRRALLVLLMVMVAGLWAGGKGESTGGGETGPVVVRLTASSSNPDGLFDRKWAENFNQSQSDIRIEIIDQPSSSSALYNQTLQAFEARSDQLDLVRVDGIWTGDFAEHLIDLSDYPEVVAALPKNFEGLQKASWLDGRLIVYPSSINGGMLIYRTDLLAKYGYSGPPKTWDELEAMAEKVQQGERAEGNADFWGFVWQGQAYEGLTCDALEWIYSEGGGTIISPERVITVNNPAARRALERARDWIGNITPQGVLSFEEEESRAVFQGGNALFMRNWPYAYNLAQADDSALKGKVGMAPVPAGASGHGAATMGPWFWGVSKYSKNPAATVQVMLSLSSAERQKSRFLAVGTYPTINSLYQDKDALAAYPIMPELLKAFDLAPVSRPSAVSAPRYNEVSVAFFDGVYKVLNREKSAEDALDAMALDLADITGFEVGS